MALPTYMQIGRGSSPGPLTGPYIPLTLGAYTLAAGVRTNEEIAAIQLPFGFRLEALSWTCDSAASAIQFDVTYNTSPAAGTSFLSGEIDLDANTTGIVRVTDEDSIGYTINSGVVGSAAWQARTRDRGSYIVLDFTSDASGATVGFTLTLWGFAVDHVNLNPLED